MAEKLAPEQQQEIVKAAKEAKEELEKKKSDDRNVAEIIAAKIALLAEIVAKGGSLSIDENDLKKWGDRWEANIIRLGEIAVAALDAVKRACKALIDFFKRIWDWIVSLFEESKGQAKVKDGSAQEKTLEGTTRSILKPSKQLKSFPLPKTMGPIRSKWTARLELVQTPSADFRLYRIVAFESKPGTVRLSSNITLQDVRQELAEDSPSTMLVNIKNGQVLGRLHTRISSSSFKDGSIPASSRLSGKVSRGRLTFRSEGRDYLSASRLFPEGAKGALARA